MPFMVKDSSSNVLYDVAPSLIEATDPLFRRNYDLKLYKYAQSQREKVKSLEARVEQLEQE